MDNSQLNTFITNSRIKAFCHEKVFDRCVLQRGQKTVVCYRFSENGKKWCDKHIDQMNSRTYYRSASPLHDMTIADKYLSLTSDQQETWQTENDLRNQFQQMLDGLRNQDIARWSELQEKWEQKRISVPDGAYQDGERTVLYECVTDNYGEVELQAKEEFSLAANLEIQYQKI